MSVDLEKTDLQLTTTFVVKGLADIVKSKHQRTRLQKDFDGIWTIQLDFPQLQDAVSTKLKKACPYLMISVHPTAPYTERYGQLSVLTVTLGLETLDGVVQQTRSFELNPLSDVGDHRWHRFMTVSALWVDNPDIQRDDGFRLAVNITSVAPPARPVIAAPLILNNILQLIEGHDVIDTKFLVFSKRRVNDDGSVGAVDPLPVYANSDVIRNQCEFFDTILGNSGFSESELVDLDRPPAKQSIDLYDYESDSDLGYFSGEEDDDNNEADEETNTVAQEPDRSKLSDRDSQSSSPPLSPFPFDDNVSDNSDIDNFLLDSTDFQPHGRFRNRFGKVVELNDAAYVTWKALIFYLCTSQISFAPLSSHGLSRSRSPSERSQGLPSRPSAKSIYRIADKYGLNDLTELALSHIRTQLSKEIIIRELFSRFTSCHSLVRDMELAFAFEHWEELKSSSELREMINQVATGGLPHAGEILASLLFH